MLNKNKLNIEDLNQVIKVSKKVLNVIYITALIAAIYVFIKIGKETGLFEGLFTLLKVISPLFIGMLIAWIFNPLVTWLQKHGMRRVLATFFVYFLFIGGLILMLMGLIPTLYTQVIEFSNSFQSILDTFKLWIDTIFLKFDGVIGINSMALEETIIAKLTETITKFLEVLPNSIVNYITNVFSGFGTFVVSIIMAFFFLIGFENMGSLIEFLPIKIQNTTKELLTEIDLASRSFLVGSLIDCLFIFIISSIGLYFAGLKAPLMFGLFCGITNIIPYIGPYIGGAPAVLMAFCQGTTTGILTLLVISVIQLLEGNILQPMILSKTTKLHPVTIMLGLLVFGYFFGIIGMVISTPIIAAFKAMVLYFDKKYDILNFN